MSDKRRGIGFPVTVGVVGAAVLLLAAYVGGYFALSDRNDLPENVEGVIRVFNAKSLARFYWPVGWCECKANGNEVTLEHYVDWPEEDWRDASDANFRP